ncbi:Uncharacterised protein [Mycobacteroides abscessus subsp. abscessus]|nr:Uncharacterised protein [Mycobacteroides abscessus subsp. abscessus]
MTGCEHPCRSQLCSYRFGCCQGCGAPLCAISPAVAEFGMHPNCPCRRDQGMPASEPNLAALDR